eukprot:CAMPEP_0197543082 /NCGR_PEP_ID=MMETSP1318-20131121/68050_1 /TAXON_ID=552666 /ORGANISM="Partenskyella glossopodia, Strain RCC365" /LENGTH=150 /DNA_ID=CAMNT_0043102393 /DNA_START=2397 /DNA_END=2849 /DNA_ORIENTATION=-
MAYAQHIPEFTAGGRRDAEIATPTKLDTLLLINPRATPKPDGTAMAIPIYNPLIWPRPAISGLGQFNLSPHGANMIPTTKPHIIQIARATISTAIAGNTRSRKLAPVSPNVMARIGPISGDTSIEATMTTVLFTARATPAKRDAIIVSSI